MSNGWRYAKIGEVCVVERGGSPRPIDKYITDDPSGINWIKIGDTNDSMYITETAQKIIPEGMKKSRYVQPGDFLLSNSMSFGRPYILKIDGCIHDGWLVLRDKDNLFDKRFLYYYLSAPSTYQKFKNMAVGGVVNNLNSEMVRGVDVPIPAKEEQLEIVNVLDKVIELITIRKQQLSKIDELVKSRFIEMFGDPISNPQKWDVKSWNDVLIIKNGRNQKQVENANGQYPICGSGGIMGYANDFITHENSVIIGRKGNINKPILMREKFWNVDTAFGLEPNTNILLVDYLYLYCVFFNFEALNKAVTIPSLTKSDLLDIDMPIPPIDLQNEFATFVSQVDKLKSEIKESLEKLETLKKSLMQKYFG